MFWERLWLGVVLGCFFFLLSVVGFGIAGREDFINCACAAGIGGFIGGLLRGGDVSKRDV